MKYSIYSKIEVTTDRYEPAGIKKGTKGVILEDYNNGDYEVQFMDMDGELTTYFFAVNESEITTSS